MGPPVGNVTFFGLKDPPIGDVTLSGTDFHGFCLVPMGFERVSWSFAGFHRFQDSFTVLHSFSLSFVVFYFLSS